MEFYGTLASGLCLADYVDPQLSPSVDKHKPEEWWKENVLLKVQTLKVFFGKLSAKLDLACWEIVR